MTWEYFIGFGLALALMAVGFVGSILPGLPGTPLVFAAAVLHRLYFGDQGASTWVLCVLAVLMAISLVVDFAAGLFGARKLGATWKGMLGASLGVLVGLFVGPVGIVVGPFAGAFLGELTGGRELRDAARAGCGAFLGLLGGAVGKIVCCVLMIGLFVLHLLLQRVFAIS